MDISVVVPLFNEEESLEELHDWIKRVCTENSLSYEIVFVDDGSTDSSWKIIEKMSKEDNQVKGFYHGCRLARFSRRDSWTI